MWRFCFIGLGICIFTTSLGSFDDQGSLENTTCGIGCRMEGQAEGGR